MGRKIPDGATLAARPVDRVEVTATEQAPGKRRGRPAVWGAAQIQAQMRWPADLLARIDAQAEREGISRSEWIRRACQAAL
jgi:hypothetical protein